MYALFSDDLRHYGSKIEASRFRDVQERIVEDVEKVVQYYRYGAFHVKTDHLLVRLINAMNVPLGYDLDHYYEVASARALFVANSFEFCSSINAGKWFDGIFYNGCQELIIASVGSDDPLELAKDWRNLKPVKVLECPVSNLKYMLPNGDRHNIEEGIAVISIDLPMLMVMYRGFWLQQQARAATGDGGKLGSYHFVGKYVIPNMLYSQTDIAIHNRLVNLQTGAPMGDSRKQQPFHISDYTGLLDKGLAEILKHISKTKLHYRTLLDMIPKVFNDRPWGMPDMAETRQVWWALFITRLKAMQFLWEVGGAPLRHYNQTELNTLRIDVKRLQSDNILSSKLPDMVLDEMNYFMRHVLSDKD